MRKICRDCRIEFDSFDDSLSLCYECLIYRENNNNKKRNINHHIHKTHSETNIWDSNTIKKKWKEASDKNIKTILSKCVGNKYVG